MPQVEVVKPFNLHVSGGTVHPPEVVEVSETRAEELKRLGLARDPAAVKAAPIPSNKMAPEPENKMGSAIAKKPQGRPLGRRATK